MHGWACDTPEVDFLHIHHVRVQVKVRQLLLDKTDIICQGREM